MNLRAHGSPLPPGCAHQPASEAKEAEAPKDYFVSNLCLLGGKHRKSGAKN